MKKLLFLVLVFLTTNTLASTEKVGVYFNSIKNNNLKLRMFINKMPKGADLHSHLGLSVYPEVIVKIALEDKHNYCVDEKYYAHQMPGCDAKKGLKNLREVTSSQSLLDNLIDNWSIRNYNISKSLPPFDYFFAAYSKFRVIRRNNFVKLTEHNITRAINNNTSYLELMVYLGQKEATPIAEKIKWNKNFKKLKKDLLKNGLEKHVNNSSRITNDYHDKLSKTKNVTIKFINVALRDREPKKFFTQLLHAFLLCKKNKHFVGINVAAPENHYYATKNYNLHMSMIGFLKKEYPNVKVSLHAGEITEKLAPPEELKYHISSAINIAKTDRIGHGVSIAHEKNADNLLKKMAKDKIAVEINLTSNDFILGVKGKDHPLPLYLEYGVPVVISTDDQGVLRTSLGKEYFLAVSQYNLTYSQLKNIVRNSLTYSFLPGKTLWLDDKYIEITKECRHDNPSAKILTKTCRKFLDQNEKAKLEWNLEKRFDVFERFWGSGIDFIL